MIEPAEPVCISHARPKPAASVQGLMDEAIAAVLAIELDRGRVEDRRLCGSLQRQAAESTSLLDVLAHLADEGAAVSLRSAPGTVTTGTITSLGTDHIVVRSENQHTRLLVLDHVESVWSTSGSAPRLVGWPHSTPTERLADVLRELVQARTLVTTVSQLGRHRGYLCAVGSDVVSIRMVGEPTRQLWLRLSAIIEVELEA